MFKRIIVSAAFFIIFGSGSAFAQSPHVEVSGFAGWPATHNTPIRFDSGAVTVHF